MKLKATSLFLGICLATFVLAANPAFARSTTGYSSFHTWGRPYQYRGAYDCLTEVYGAVVNNCGYSLGLEFDMPIDNTGNHTIWVQNYWYGSGTFSCTPWSYTGSGPSGYYGPTINFTRPGQSLQTNVNVPYDGMSIQLICSNVPAGSGVANINWTQ